MMRFVIILIKFLCMYVVCTFRIVSNCRLSCSGLAIPRVGGCVGHS